MYSMYTMGYPASIRQLYVKGYSSVSIRDSKLKSLRNDCLSLQEDSHSIQDLEVPTLPYICTFITDTYNILYLFHLFKHQA